MQSMVLYAQDPGGSSLPRPENLACPPKKKKKTPPPWYDAAHTTQQFDNQLN